MPGFGFAAGGVMILAEIIINKVNGRNGQMFAAPFGTLLLILTISSTLAAVTIYSLSPHLHEDYMQ